MGMPAQDAIWTADMVRALPDDGLRHEVLDGVHVVSPSPSRAHQRAVRVLLSMLEPYCAQHRLGEALNSPADIEFSDRDLLQPDVFVVPNTGPSWREATTLLLAVEVLSPSTARTDRHAKRTTYLRYRVPEYWIVDLDARLFERWRPDDRRPEVLHDVLAWEPRAGLPPLEIHLPAFFEAVLR
jgi:Uma2 family endonuclease